MSHAPTLPRSTAAPAHYQRLARLERVTMVHVLVMLVVSSWYFGGASRRSENFLIGGGALAAALLVVNLWVRGRARRSRLPFLWLLPWILFNALVAISCANPSFTERIFEGVPMLSRTGAPHPHWPSTIYPAETWRKLFLFDACYLTAFNLLLVFRRRRTLRTLLAVIVVNGTILAVFGTMQKFSASGIFFGAVASPNARFFATFVYGNHWSAYATLVFACGMALAWQARRRRQEAGERRSAEFLLYVALLACALTPFISGSRAGMVMLGTAGFGLAGVCLRLAQKRGGKRSWQLPAVLLGALLALGMIGYELGHTALRERWLDTEEQWRDQPLRGREQLYRDTWKLIRERPVFGWGFGSFGKAYLAEHPRSSAPNRQYERSYANAHSDWLEILADTGGVGATLLLAALFLPFVSAYSWRHRGGADLAVLAGCAAILGYALIEFPFGNPAVCLLWWMCFFAALQYHRLNRKHAEREDFPAY